MQTSPIPLLGSIRVRRGLTQQDLAKRAGASQGFISALESGRSPLNSDLAGILAGALDSLPELLRKPAPNPLILQRLQGSLPARTVKLVVADLALAHFHVRQLLGSPSANVLRDTRAASPTDHARAFRETWRVPPGPVKDMIRLVEEHGIVCLWRETSAIHTGAVGSWAHGEHPVIFLGRELSPRAARVELAREIGRAAMQHLPAPPTADEVDTFAEEFLLPERDVAWSRFGALDWSRAGLLEEEWGVPPAVLLRAAYRAGAITKTRRRMLNSIVLDMGTDATPAARERPRRLLDAVQQQAAVLGGGFDRVAAHALLDLPSLQRDYLANAG